MSNETKQVAAAIELAIDANAAAMALYTIIGKTVQIDHDEFMKLKEEHASQIREGIENIVK